MKWATRKNLRVDRVACVWLIKKFIDLNPDIIFVDDDQIENLTKQGVLTFDAEHAKYRHDEDYENGKYGERCTFEILIDEYKLIENNPALQRMGKILNAADIGHRIGVYEPKAGYGLWVIAHGFSLTTPDDEDKLIKEIPIYDAIYAYCQQTNILKD
jgi:hypothetical protein